MANKKLIPCRTCGKLFEPCAYCQSHADVFRWRNFACSRECATKYINDAIAYRESLKQKKQNLPRIIEAAKVGTEIPIQNNTSAKRKYNKKASTEVMENKIEINETK